MASLNRPLLSFVKQGIDLKTVANHTIVEAQSGKIWVPVDNWMVIRTKTGSGTGATVSIGTNSGSNAYDDIRENLPIADDAVLDVIQLGVDPVGEPANDKAIDIGSNPVVFRVQAAATHTTQTCDVIVVGYFL